MDAEPELVLAVVPLIGIELFVPVEGADEVAGIDAAAEELETVVRVSKYLDELQSGATADAADRQPVHLFVRLQDLATVPEGHVAHDARGIIVIGATKAM